MAQVRQRKMTAEVVETQPRKKPPLSEVNYHQLFEPRPVGMQERTAGQWTDKTRR